MIVDTPARVPELRDWQQRECDSRGNAYTTDFDVVHWRRQARMMETCSLDELDSAVDSFCDVKVDSYPQPSASTSQLGVVSAIPAEPSEESQCASASTQGLGDGTSEVPVTRVYEYEQMKEEEEEGGIPSSIVSFLEAARKIKTRDRLPMLPRLRHRKDFEQRVVLGVASAFHLGITEADNPPSRDRMQAEPMDTKGKPREEEHRNEGVIRHSESEPDGELLTEHFGSREETPEGFVVGQDRARKSSASEGEDVWREGEEEAWDPFTVSDSECETECGTTAQGIWMELETSVLEDESHILFMEAAKKAHLRDRKGRMGSKRPRQRNV